MLFNSIEFLLFLPTVTALYFLLPYRFRWVLLLVASYLFYMAWEPGYLILIVISTLIPFFSALRMAAAKSTFEKRAWFAASVSASVGLLAVFKYYNFFNHSLASVFALAGWRYGVPDLHFLLPVGISFYTFQTLSYTIDVYTGRKSAEPHLGIFALYVAFFPQLVAGPIERSTHLLPQFYKKFDFDYARLRDGLCLALWGMFKKVVIADRLALIVDHVYSDPTQYSGAVLTFATVLFAFQIFCDFSAYSDIAIGTARILGYDLMLNFNRPYHARGIADFWARWHISLSTWFRDYMYIPLGGNRVAIPRWYMNILVVFGVSGLWHGANWTFVIWGLLHGSYYLFSHMTRNVRAATVRATGLARMPRLHGLLQIIFIFAIVNLGWIFFRANSLADALYIVGHLHTGWGALATDGLKAALLMPLDLRLREAAIIVAAVAVMEGMHWLQGKNTIEDTITRWPLPVRWAMYVGLILAVLNLGIAEEIPFIYFQF